MQMQTSLSAMNQVEQALAYLDNLLHQQHLNHVQEIVFRAAWQGQSYLDCAKLHGYSPEYIKAVGYKLWQLLSDVFQEPVNKNNLHCIFRRHLNLSQSEAIENYFDDANQLYMAENKIKITDLLLRKPRQNCIELVNISSFYGRIKELQILSDWVTKDNCRLIGIFGMKGSGKTALTCKLVQQIQEQFDYVWWYSLESLATIEDFLADLITFLSDQNQAETDFPESLGGQISRLIYYLRAKRCLIVVDDVEAILDSGNYNSAYLPGYEGYGLFWRYLGELNHHSTMIITSCEKPKEIELLEGEKSPVHSLKVSGLNPTETQAIFHEKNCVSALNIKWNLLNDYYGGNPLFLKLVASLVQNLFDSSMEEYMQTFPPGLVILDDIRELLDNQFQRLSQLEQSVMYWLAIHRHPVSLSDLRDDLWLLKDKKKLPEALLSLDRRGIIEKAKESVNQSTTFTLQPIIMDYVTDCFVDQIADEIITENISLLASHAMMIDRTKNSVQAEQKQAIICPLAEQLLNLGKSFKEIECNFNNILMQIKDNTLPGQDYSIKNLINLTSQLNLSVVDNEVY